MYDNIPLKSTSANTHVPHKFFERNLDSNLDDLSLFLGKQYDRIKNGEILKNDQGEKHSGILLEVSPQVSGISIMFSNFIIQQSINYLGL